MCAVDVHRLRDDNTLRQQIEDELDINIWQICKLTDLKVSHLRTMFHNANVQPSSRSKGNSYNANVWYRWGDVRVVLWPQNDHPSMSDMEIIEETDGTGRRAWWGDKILEIHREIEEQKRKQREAKERRRIERQERREMLRNQMIDNFPSWLREDQGDQVAYVHVGPTNSGKTHDALIELAAAGSGWYLAPLRLLAREMFERLNRMGAFCNLLTGEERIDIPGAQITAATIEMFNAERSGECVVIDEAHMVADLQRGWAWTQALVNARASQLRVITAPQGLNLVTRMFDSIGVETQVLFHNRLVPLEVAAEPWSLENLPERTILIAFTRRDVLELKHRLQELGRQVSVVYGALPPEVRLKQAQRFEAGDSEICVATDAVGMGLNLPADNVVFSTLTKFDGFEQRRLRAGELQQIGGRAGRYGLAEIGYVNGVDWNILKDIRRLMNQDVPDVKVARLAPRTDEIELLEGDLAARLTTWQQLNAIPEDLRNILTSTELTDRIDLAQFLSYNDFTQLGVDRALTLVSAPTRKDSREYWVECATAILRNEPLPLPPSPPTVIQEGYSLKQAEMVIACIDVYLWLGYRQPFQQHVADPEPIIRLREELTREIDLALMRRFDPNVSRRRSRKGGWWYDDE
jgi:ATP-dependent RNA helicase SUPV3L1/SUV3